MDLVEIDQKLSLQSVDSEKCLKQTTSFSLNFLKSCMVLVTHEGAVFFFYREVYLDE